MIFKKLQQNFTFYLFIKISGMHDMGTNINSYISRRKIMNTIPSIVVCLPTIIIAIVYIIKKLEIPFIDQTFN